jgi:cytochrome c biogenesis protein CcmG/thiol:disulfide interchange protein DsbE
MTLLYGARAHGRSLRALVAAIVGVLLLAAYTPSALAIGAGTLAPEIGLKDLSGRGVSIASLKGKVVLVDFWASWCAPCREELPVLEALYKKYRARGFEVVGVNLDQSADNVQRFLNATPLSFRVVHDRGRAVADRYAPAKMPSSFLIDRKGVVRHVHAGFRASDRGALDQQIATLLGAR